MENGDVVMFDPAARLLLGLATGVLFGVLLQKAQVAKFHKITGQLLLKDFTVLKVMGTAIAVGTVGVHILADMGWAALHPQSAALARIIAGGVLFGAGLGVFGYCPGTGVAACAEGRRDAMVGVLGMLAGAMLYVVLLPALQPWFLAWPDFGKTTFPALTGTSAMVWAWGLAVDFAILLVVLETLHPRRLDEN